MKRVILCPNPYRDKGLSAAKEADAILRQMGLETVFCLPFRPEGGEQQFGVTCKPLQQELRGSRYAPDAVLAHMANLHAKVVHNVVIPSAPTRDQKDIFALFRVHPAKQYPLKGKA